MSTKYQRQIERILKKWAATPDTTVTEIAKQDRWPAGAPGSKGGQFAPTKGGAGGYGSKYPGGGKPWPGEEGSGAVKYTSFAGMFTGNSKFPGGDSPAWAAEQNAKPKAPPPGAKPHPHVNDNGQPVTINYPTKASDKASWTDPNRTATFTPGSDTPATLNGVALKSWASVPKSDSEWAAVPGQKLSLDARFPFEPTPGKSTGAGVIIKEPDGRVWLTKPTNEFGGYKQTFPKGTVEHGLSMQASAIKETWEETGLQIKIVGVLGDYERTTSKARFYIAERVGGTPADMGWESQAVRLSPLADMQKLLNMGVDKEILSDLETEGFFEKAAAPKAGSKGWEKQARWPQGTPLGGQWKKMDGDGVTMPPTLAGGLTGSNSQYQKKADALYAAAKAGEKTTVLDTAIALEKKVQENKAKGASSSHAKWNAQLSQFATQLASDIFTAVKASAIAERLSSMVSIAKWTMVGGKPGGSNPGAMYQDEKGQQWLVKGNKQYTTGAVTGQVSLDRAKNEVLAARLMQAAGVGAPDMLLVDMAGKHGPKEGPGGVGVASKWVDGAAKFNPNDPAHLTAARADFAVHAWLGNYDVMGMGYDNTVILNGKAVNIDPGGAILFRAQGLPKDSFGKDASEWETMRKTTTEQKAVFGKMTKSDLKASAAKLAVITDDMIRELVKTHGPGDEAGKKELADTLIARRDAILAKAGVTKADTLGGVKGAPAAAADKPAAEPPSIKQANTPAAPVAGLTKPVWDGSMTTAPAYYDGLADKMLAAHAAGDMAALKAASLNKYGKQAWPQNSVNGKLMQPFFDTLVADLEKQKGVAAQEVAAGKATLTGTDGKTWVADDKGVLQPAASTPPTFSNYSDALAWSKDKAKQAGLGWKAYTATAEFKDVDYPILTAAYSSVTAAKEQKATETVALMESKGIKPGDKVTANIPGPFLSTATVTGTVKVGVKGATVHLDSPLTVSSKGKLSEKKTMPLTPMWEKVGGAPAPAAASAAPAAASATAPAAPKPLSQMDINTVAQKVGLSLTEISSHPVKSMLADLAMAGDAATLKMVSTNAPQNKALKDALLEAMTGQAAAPAAPSPAPVAPPAPAAAAKPDYDTLYSAVAATGMNMNPSKWTGSQTQLWEFAIKGDVEAVKAINPIKAVSQSMKEALLGALGALQPGQGGSAASAPRPAKPVIATPQPVPPPAPKVPTAAPPDFAKAMLTSGTNAASHNAKISQIKALFEAGDEKGILALKLGTNTYAPKQVKVANDALAALGSVHQVTKGQAANSHPALTGGTVQAAPAAPKPAKAAPAKPHVKPFDPSKITTPPDFKTMGAGGGGLSSVPAINEANNTAVKAIYEAASKGDLDALKALTFPEVNKGTGQFTGKQIPFASGTHPSQHVNAYFQNLLSEVDLQLNPPVVTPIGQRVSAADWDGGFSNLKPVPAGKAVAAVEKTAKAGDYIILGVVKDVPTSSLPKVDNTVVASANWKNAAISAYHASPQKAKDTFGLYVSTTGAKALNEALRGGNIGASINGRTAQQHVQDFKSLLVDIPEGSTFTRNMGLKGYGAKPDEKKIKALQQFLMGAETGTVIQEPGFSSSSWGKQILSDNDIQWKFTAGKGVKAYPAWLTTNAGEGESLFPPNQRYMITGAKKQGKTVVVEAILLPTID